MNSLVKLPKDQVTALCPSDVQLYLTSRGWISEPFGPAGKGLLFRHPSTSQVDLLLPLTRDLADFAARMAELVVNLSAFEQRSVWEILNDLSGPPGDVLRLCRERLVGKLLGVEKSLRLHFPEIAGQTVLAAEVSGEPSRVKVDLLPEEFAKACEALRDNRCVAVTGIIRHDVKARAYVLSQPQDFQVLDESETHPEVCR